MKRVICVILCFTYMFTLCSCQQNQDQQRSLSDISSSTYAEETKQNSEPLESSEEKDSNTIRIGVLFFRHPDVLEEVQFSPLMQERIKTQQTILSSRAEEINDYLVESNQDYKVSFELLVPDEKDEIDYTGCDMLYGQKGFYPSELEEQFYDLADELKEGKLRPLYDSMPEVYWDTVSVNGHIYNTARFYPNEIQTVDIPETILEKTGLTVPEELIGKDIGEWKDFFGAIYEANDHIPVLRNPVTYGEGWTKPIFSANVWDSQFQMITSCLGISYEKPEEGIQCVYESEYAKKMLDIWKEFEAAGYIEFYQDRPEMSLEQSKERGNNMLSVEPGCDLGHTTCWYAHQVRIQIGHDKYATQTDIHSAPELPTIKQYQVLVLKETEKFEKICEFLNDMSQDETLLQIVHHPDEEGNLVVFLSPHADLLEGAVLGVDLNEKTIDENREKKASRLAALQPVPAPGFVFDPSNVKKQNEAIISLLASTDAKLGEEVQSAESWKSIDARLESIVEQLYEAGLQDIIDEANRQLEAYQK